MNVAHDRWATLPVGGRTVRIRLPDAHDPIGVELAAGRWSLPSPARLVLDLLDGAGTLLDVGAHLGTVSLPAAALGARVVAIEASPRNAACLRESAAANALPIEVVVAAAGERRGTVRFHEAGPYGLVVAEGVDPDAVEVPSDTVPGLLASVGVARVDVVKLDVEGHEPAVLDGMAGMLAAPDAPAVVFEGNGHLLRAQGIDARALVDRFARHGYDVYLVDDGELVATSEADLPTTTVADYLATRAAPPWRVRGPLHAGEVADRLAAEIAHAVADHRAFAAATLADAPAEVLTRRDLERALEAALIDPDARVRSAASWWPARRAALAEAGHAPSGAALARARAHAAGISDQAAALAARAQRTRRTQHPHLSFVQQRGL